SGPTGHLAAGSTIVAVFPAGFTLVASPAIVLGGAFSNCSAAGAAVGTTLTVTLSNSAGTCALADATAATFTASGITNANVDSSGSNAYANNAFSLKTSADATVT